jgi:hypothetical protein
LETQKNSAERAQKVKDDSHIVALAEALKKVKAAEKELSSAKEAKETEGEFTKEKHKSLNDAIQSKKTADDTLNNLIQTYDNEKKARELAERKKKKIADSEIAEFKQQIETAKDTYTKQNKIDETNIRNLQGELQTAKARIIKAERERDTTTCNIGGMQYHHEEALKTAKTEQLYTQKKLDDLEAENISAISAQAVKDNLHTGALSEALRKVEAAEEELRNAKQANKTAVGSTYTQAEYERVLAEHASTVDDARKSKKTADDEIAALIETYQKEKSTRELAEITKQEIADDKIAAFNKQIETAKVQHTTQRTSHANDIKNLLKQLETANDSITTTTAELEREKRDRKLAKVATESYNIDIQSHHK